MNKFKMNLEFPLPKVEPIKLHHLIIIIFSIFGIIFGYFTYEDILEIAKNHLK